ncbi:MAG: hypothetical protein AVDCRST_MAG35-2526 [uncultured Quadrisphaera sp.]|uniref:Uncharacterized protein n=1 Tax=uncultured Quadrisphaera sp. TaxID=904978 RepID=A0A6J4Q231_9ACTN|nr:MAG: hypothetical protein AVDCRST_MAG35-2526 [uncultured Quadrisphaera sp.]
MVAVARAPQEGQGDRDEPASRAPVGRRRGRPGRRLGGRPPRLLGRGRRRRRRGGRPAQPGPLGHDLTALAHPTAARPTAPEDRP